MDKRLYVVGFGVKKEKNAFDFTKPLPNPYSNSESMVPLDISDSACHKCILPSVHLAGAVIAFDTDQYISATPLNIVVGMPGIACT